MTRITKCAQSFAETSIDGERVLLHLESGEFFSVLDSALAIWAALDEVENRKELLAHLARQYEIPESELEPDVDFFLSELSEAGLVRLD